MLSAVTLGCSVVVAFVQLVMHMFVDAERGYDGIAQTQSQVSRSNWSCSKESAWSTTRALTIISQSTSHRAFGSAREGELINQDRLPNLGRSPKEGLDVGTNVFAPARCEATPKLVSITYSKAYSAL